MIITAMRFMFFIMLLIAGRMLADSLPIAGSGPQCVLRLEPSSGNPRNSEGDFIRLADGRILFIYTRFTGGSGDHAAADLAGRFSSDDGKTWTTNDVVIVRNEGGLNVMSVSLLRLRDGRIALFYLCKRSLTDCRPLMRVSTDEAKTWSAATTCIDDVVGYYVMNNDRAVQLKSGRLVLPVALHQTPAQEKFDPRALIMCYFSDDKGKSWRRSKTAQKAKSSEGKEVTLQEPGVVELKDGRLMMFCRTDAGVQYISFSADGGDTWSGFKASNIVSPLSPASIKRIPKTGGLLLVWNNSYDSKSKTGGNRTPFNVAISQDEGETWRNVRTIEADADGWYCYTAIEFVGDFVLLGHCAGNRKDGDGLGVTQITRFPVEWLYSK